MIFHLDLFTLDGLCNVPDSKVPFFPGNSKFLQNRLVLLRSDLIGLIKI